MCLTLNPSSEPEHSLGMGKHGGGGRGGDFSLRPMTPS